MFTQSMNDYNIISISHTDLAVDITVELECQITYLFIYKIIRTSIMQLRLIICISVNDTLEFRIQDIHKINARNDNTICNEIKKSPNNEIVFSFNKNVFIFLIFGGPI